MIKTFTLFGQHEAPHYICQELKNNMIMAKQRGPVFIEGTIDGRTYYKRDGKYYVRKKSSLSSRRVKRSPAFKRTMEYAGWMAGASVIASVIYWRLPAKEKKRKRYQALTGEAMRLLRDGVDETTVRAKLEAAHLQKEVECNMEVKPVVGEADLKLMAGHADAKPEVYNAGSTLNEMLSSAQVVEDELTAVNTEPLAPITGQQVLAGSAVPTSGAQPINSHKEARSIAVIPAPAAIQRQPRVLRYKAKRKRGATDRSGGFISKRGYRSKRGFISKRGYTSKRKNGVW